MMLSRTSGLNQNTILRPELAAAIKAAREILSSQGKPSGFKAMGSMIGTAPKRISELSNPEFFLDFGDPQTRKSEHAIAKTVVGFASSIFKVIEWLARVLPNGVSNAHLGALITSPQSGQNLRVNTASLHDLIAEFWPHECLGYEFNSSRCRHWIDQGLSAAQGELSRSASLSVTVSVVEWGPFSTAVPGFVPWSVPGQDANARDEPDTSSVPSITDTPIVNYGASLLAAIDPIQFRPDLSGLFVTKALQEALSGLPSSRAGNWQVALGVYDSLYRQYEGYKFVTLPVRTPIMAIEFDNNISNDEYNSVDFERLDFETFFSDPQADFEVFVIPRESGHLAIGRLANARLIREIDIASANPLKILEIIARTRDTRKRAFFVSDSILCFAIYRILRDLGYQSKSKFLFQEKPSDLSFRIGFMLREDDEKLYRMMLAAQLEIFRSPSKAINLISHIAAATATWAEGADWPFPFFVIDSEALHEMARDDISRNRIIEHLHALGNQVFEIDV